MLAKRVRTNPTGKMRCMASFQLSFAMKGTVHLVKLTLESLVSSTYVRALPEKRCWQKCVMATLVKQRLKTFYASMIIAIRSKLLSLGSAVCHVQEVTVDTIKEYLSARRTVAHLHQQKALASLRALSISMVLSCRVVLTRSSALVRFVPALIQISLSRLIFSISSKMVRWSVKAEGVACNTMDTMVMIRTAIKMTFSKLGQHLPHGINQISIMVQVHLQTSAQV